MALARMLAALVLGSAAAVAQGAPTPDVEKLAIDTEILRKKVELASGSDFYLVLDPSARTLQLMLKGAELRRYPVLALEIADPQVAFVSRGESHDWQGKIWIGGTLVPQREQDRVEIKAPPQGSDVPESAPAIPPTPEEKYPVPPRYGIRYQGGLFVEIRPEGDDPSHDTFGHRLSAWWEDFKEALRPEPSDRIRLRLTLQLEDARAVYRSLPPDTKLFALPPA